jgi:hypothetical protein
MRLLAVKGIDSVRGSILAESHKLDGFVEPGPKLPDEVVELLTACANDNYQLHLDNVASCLFSE